MSRCARRPGSAGFTLIEMLTTVALLVIVLGLMVSLARHVREQSAQALTESLLRQLDTMMTQYADRNGGRLPIVSPFPPPEATPPESAFQPPASNPTSTNPSEEPAAGPARGEQRQLLLRAALANNRDVIQALRSESEQANQALAALPVSVSEASQLRDAWGSPIVFMPQMHPWIGTAPRDKAYFFFSAGPDRRYLVRVDNLYSYEEIVGPAGKANDP